jgi:hypothetical protein
METEPEPSPRNQRVYAPYRIQCPRCGEYYPNKTKRYRNPQTGAYESIKVLPGCLISLLALIVLEVVGGVVIYIVNITLHPSEFSYLGGLGYVIPFVYAPVGAIIAAVIAIPLYRARRRRTLSKTYITVRHFVCRQCKNEWTVTQEPMGQTKRRRSPAGTVSLILLALILLGGISFGIYHVSLSGTSNQLQGVAWSGSELVAVGGNGTILTSPDGHTWTT